MLDAKDFSKKQIVVCIPARGDKISYRNDNMIISDGKGNIKYQHTCYRIFMLIIVGDMTLTTGIIRRAQKFGFSICFMTLGFKLYSMINSGMQGNTLLHKKQYDYQGTDLAQRIIYNKISNQRKALSRIRRKNEEIKEGISLLDIYADSVIDRVLELDSLLGIEGNAAKVYFPRIFNQLQWRGRKPRIKFDYINSLLDIGYNMLFNFVDCILQVFGFDTYKGVMHTCFYMRKSLVCDIMEPFRCIIDWRVRKGCSLGQFKEEDFTMINGQWQLEYKNSAKYCSIFMEDLLDNKECIFAYIRDYYRAFMKGKEAGKYPLFDFEKEVIINEEDFCNDYC